MVNQNVDDEEAGETKDPTRGQTTLFDDPRDVQVEDIDELIKPIRIMNKSIMTESSPAIDSTSERTASYVSEESNLL
ncbi:hypothetical protein F0562_023527 [Nyssa sinensis]|uniref:Uncharacterized protein n=1 Tax=Nyssa sinensis TaxID=561372 RepID=A0A5J5BKI8_9ASTE|nr:hypothetical protein F0562_023527 [Nyssa sinensis]